MVSNRCLLWLQEIELLELLVEECVTVDLGVVLQYCDGLFDSSLILLRVRIGGCLQANFEEGGWGLARLHLLSHLDFGLNVCEKLWVLSEHLVVQELH